MRQYLGPINLVCVLKTISRKPNLCPCHAQDKPTNECIPHKITVGLVIYPKTAVTSKTIRHYVRRIGPKSSSSS